MTNIPTDLLRTLVAVVDQRSFTKAAASLGVTQPAVSAQIKRLQILLGSEVLDRSSQGVSLTPQGEKIVSYARRLLSINDQIVDFGRSKTASESIIRVGAPGDFVASVLSPTLARYREQCPSVRYSVRLGTYEPLVRDLQQGDIDLLVCLSASAPIDARHSWQEEVAWVRGKNTKIDTSRPIPLISYGEKSLNRFLAVGALKKAGLEWEDVFISPSLVTLSGAVIAGLGVMALVRRRASAFGLDTWDDGPLPALSTIYCGIYVREGGEREALEPLADTIAEVLRPGGEASANLFEAFSGSFETDKAANSVA